MHPDRAIAPMNTQEMLPVCGIDSLTLAEIGDLLARKATTREMGEGAVPPSIQALIRQEFDAARLAIGAAGPPRQVLPAAVAEVDRHLQRRLPLRVAPIGETDRRGPDF